MGPRGVVPRNRPREPALGICETCEAVLPDVLLLQDAEKPFDHPVLRGRVRGDELLFQAIASNEAGVITARKNQTIVRPKQEGMLNSAK